MRVSERKQSTHLILNDPRSVRLDERGKSLAYFCQRDIVRVDRQLVTQLKNASWKLGGKNVRLCLHKSPDESFHEMIILSHKNKYYYRPHRHLMKGESYYIIEGLMAVFVFDDNGGIIDTCLLKKDRDFIYRVGVNMYHTSIPLSDFVIYYEAKPGPFIAEEDSLYPSWAPDGSNSNEAGDYTNKLLQILEK